MRKLTKEFVLSVANNYKTKNEFKKNDESAYKKACQMGWINEIPWMTVNKNHSSNDYCIYAYVDDINKFCYVGLTKDIRKRHQNHKNGNCKRISSIYKHFMSIGVEFPQPIILENKLDAITAQKEELEYYLRYSNSGYKMLNKAKMGVNTGSLGATYVWTKEGVMIESKKYTSRTDFKKYSNGAYNVARKNKWIKEMTWLKSRKKESGYWNNKENVIIEANKYKTREEFMKNASGAYHSCIKNGWLDEVIDRQTNRYTKEDIMRISKQYKTKRAFTKDYEYLYKVCMENGYFEEMWWLSDINNKWKTKDDVFKAAKECKTKTEFQKKYKGAYDKARKNGWIIEMNWFTTIRHNWTFNELLDISRKFKSNTEFNNGYHSAYVYAYKHNFIQEIRKINNW